MKFNPLTQGKENVHLKVSTVTAANPIAIGMICAQKYVLRITSKY